MTISTSPCDFEAHVAEEAGGVQRLDRLRGLLVVDALADLDRQVAEDRARFGALHAFDADVPDDERLEGRERRTRRRAAPRRATRQRERATRMPPRSDASAARGSEQTGEVIEKRQRHQHGQHGHADALADLEGAVGNADCP